MTPEVVVSEPVPSAPAPAAETAPAATVPGQRLAVDGEFTIHAAAERRTTLLMLLASFESLTGPGATGDGPVELDVSEVSELDTAGLQVLLVARRELAALGRSLRLVGAGPAVTDVLAIAHLTTELTGAGPAAVTEEHVR